jgi:hypothetical protein
MSRGEWASNLTLNWNILARGILGGFSVLSSVYSFFLVACHLSCVRASESHAGTAPFQRRWDSQDTFNALSRRRRSANTC